MTELKLRICILINNPVLPKNEQALKTYCAKHYEGHIFDEYSSSLASCIFVLLDSNFANIAAIPSFCCLSTEELAVICHGESWNLTKCRAEFAEFFSQKLWSLPISNAGKSRVRSMHTWIQLWNASGHATRPGCGVFVDETDCEGRWNSSGRDDGSTHPRTCEFPVPSLSTNKRTKLHQQLRYKLKITNINTSRCHNVQLHAYAIMTFDLWPGNTAKSYPMVLSWNSVTKCLSFNYYKMSGKILPKFTRISTLQNYTNCPMYLH